MSKRSRDRYLIQLGPGLQPDKLLSYDDFNAGTEPQPVVCQRCADGAPVVASVRDVCVRCLAAVWVSRISEESMRHLRQPALWCLQCFAAHIAEETQP